MRTIVSIQAKRESSRGLVHYIAHSKTDSEKEPKTRELFTEYSDQISVEAANEFLKTGVEKKRPENSQLHHVVISLKTDDYEKLGVEETERKHSLKLLTRIAMEKLAESIGADKLSWIAGIHRNTKNPHVHIAIQKEYFDEKLEKKTLTKIPNSLLPHYEKDGEARNFVRGEIIEAIDSKLENIITSKKIELTLPIHNKETDFHQENPRENDQKEREILAQAILAKYYVEKSRENLESLENHGDKRRFKIYDAVSRHSRSMSLFDLERRAESNANRNQKLKNISDEKKRDAEKSSLINAEMAQNLDGIKRIKTILHKLITNEHRTLQDSEAKYNEVQPLAEKIRLQYRCENRKLPIPKLTPVELEMLQIHSIEKGDIRTSEYFERVRNAVADECGTPPRSGEDIAKLKAKAILSGLKVLSAEKQISMFEVQKRNSQVEIDGSKWSLAKLDKLVEDKANLNKTVAGKIGSVLGKIGVLESPIGKIEIDQLRTQIDEKLNERFSALKTEQKREESIHKMLEGFIEKDASEHKETILPRYTAFELAEVEKLSFDLKLSDVYRQNFEAQKSLANTQIIDNINDKETKQAKEKIIAGRAFAREILCEIEVAQSKAALAKFREFRVFQKFEIVDPKTNAANFVSLKEVEFDLRGSILDHTLEYFFENREKRKMRHELEKTAKEKEAELKSNVRAAKEMLKTAREETIGYRSRSYFGSVTYDVQPIFTPKEILNVEFRIAETGSGREAKKLQKILDSVLTANTTDQSKAQNLATILEVLSMEHKFANVIKKEPIEMNERDKQSVKEEIDIAKER